MPNGKEKATASETTRQTRAQAAASLNVVETERRLPETAGETMSTGETATVPSVQEIWETLRGVATQLSMLSAAVAARPTQQVLPDPPVAPREAERVHRPVRAERQADYLTVLDHVIKMGTKSFMGSSDPMEADQWKSRLIRNFQATRCPDEYKKDIAVHFLDGTAYDWWLIVEKRYGRQVLSFREFELEFDQKYFPVEAYDRLETTFLNLVQGSRSVREYEEEFSRLRKYVRAELDGEQVQIRRFLRGLKAEIRTHCSVRTFGSVYELVERAVIIESSLAEERHASVRTVAKPSVPPSRKRRIDGPSTCPKCGRGHTGKCWGANYSGREPRTSWTQEKGAVICFECNQPGHYARDCPKRIGGRPDKPIDARPVTMLPPPPKRPAIAPRAYAMVREEGGPSNTTPVTGKTLSP